MKKVVHFSSVHGRYDIRVFLKECVTLASNGYDVTYVVADGLGDEVKDGVRILDVGSRLPRRLGRMLYTTKEIFKKVSSIRADLYHFHDPELIPVGVKIKKSFPSAKVIFDSHENYADDIEDKEYIPIIFRRFVSSLYRVYERFAVKKLDGVIAATPSIFEHFKMIGVKVKDVNNYPFLSEFDSSAFVSEIKYDAIYIGAMSEVRGVKQLVDACAIGKPITLVLAGTVSPEFLDVLKSSQGWKYVTYLGQVDRDRVRELLSVAKVAVVTFLPAANHIESQPNKMFEYMSSSIPVIASHFPLWRKIIEDGKCGVCVDPASPEQISSGIHSLISDPNRLKELGTNGRLSIINEFNWEREADVLIRYYHELLESDYFE